MNILMGITFTSILLPLASSLQCYQYQGVSWLPQKQNVITCEPNAAFCTSTLIKLNGTLYGEILVKGCLAGNESTCNKTTTTDKKITQIYESVQCCNTELCNSDLIPDVSSTKDHGIQCYVCNGNPASCNGDQLPTVRCTGEQTQCMEISIEGAVTGNEKTRLMLKGCGNLTSCGEFAAFSNGLQPLSYSAAMRCCKGSACNSGTFAESEPGKENGVECYSCADSEQGGCSPEHVKKMKCTGAMTQCLDIIGDTHNRIIMKGCATDSFCQRLYPDFRIPVKSSTSCCSGSLCNQVGIGTSEEAKTKN
ncbi:urokinase plasminogen activator surface receptor [Microcaecilia unicolor]|uniref:Urokinase plasminogen activator surface receptor-like n=1 Tax=Microcaecilia unicolor TaxID=1415580 RepID=A0A6P7X1N6_9AMPH|nr:urokinase plasminogen activator surface receptor-like [Microcaecilia unicolor]